MIAPSDGDSTTNRALLTALANGPDRYASTPWSNPARHIASRIHNHIARAEHHNIDSVSFTDLHDWRSSLDAALDQLASTDPGLWDHWRQPGTWLDSLLRLRSLLAHILAKAYWGDHSEVSYADMDVPRFLWGAR